MWVLEGTAARRSAPLRVLFLAARHGAEGTSHVGPAGCRSRCLPAAHCSRAARPPGSRAAACVPRHASTRLKSGAARRRVRRAARRVVRAASPRRLPSRPLRCSFPMTTSSSGYIQTLSVTSVRFTAQSEAQGMALSLSIIRKRACDRPWRREADGCARDRDAAMAALLLDRCAVLVAERSSASRLAGAESVHASVVG